MDKVTLSLITNSAKYEGRNTKDARLFRISSSLVVRRSSLVTPPNLIVSDSPTRYT